MFTRMRNWMKGVWARFCAGVRRPTIAFIAGANSGAAMGRIFFWSYLGVLAIMVSLWWVAVIAIAMALWELYLSIHVMTMLSWMYATTRPVAGRATATVVQTDGHVAPVPGV